MIVLQVLNNNTVIGMDDERRELVIMGRGIGFYAKPGDSIDPEKVQRVFSPEESSRLNELISHIPTVYLETVEEIVARVESAHGIKLNDGIYLALTDHLFFAIDRYRQGIELDNPFLIDVRHYYKREWKAALDARDVIRKHLDVEVDEGEVGYIALHLIEAEYRQDRRDFRKVFDVIDTTMDFIRKDFLPNAHEESLAYTRLLNHVKFFAKRYVERSGSAPNDELLASTLRSVFQDEQACVERLSDLLRKTYGDEMSDAEKSYLVLHLRNCRASPSPGSDTSSIPQPERKE